MAVAVLHPQDCLKQPFAHMKYPRNPTSCPKREKKTRRSPPRNQITRSPPPLVSPPLPPPRSTVSASSPTKKNHKSRVVFGQVRILKRGEVIPKETVDPVKEKSDLRSTPRIRSDPITIPNQIRISDRESETVPIMIPDQIHRKSKIVPYAGPVTLTSPPPSDVPLPAFFAAKKSIPSTDATNDLIRILRLDIA